MIASENDGIWYNEKTNKEIDLDETFGIDSIKDIVFDSEDGYFYFLCNKKQEKLGFFLIKFKENDPYDYVDLTMWKHRLDIDNANLFILRGKDPSTNKYFKELVVSYKTIYINTYMVCV